MPAEHVLTPDDKCPCGKPQEGSGYCSYECYSKHDLGAPIEAATSPASIGDRPGFEPRHPNAVPARCDGCPAPARWTRDGSRYCDEHAVLTTPMTTTDPTPASMGGPLSEAERRAEIQARLAAATPAPWIVGGTDRLGNRYIGNPDPEEGGPCATAGDIDAELIANAPGDLAYLLEQNALLEGQLATARERLAPFAAQHRPCKNMFRTCVTCRDGYGEPLPWPCRDAKRLGLVTTCPACSDWVLRDGDANCPSCDADLTALALGLDGGGSDGTA